MRDERWIAALTDYAERLHAAADLDHHVVSALGAWMLVALCAPLADEEGLDQMAEVLGGDPMAAARFTAELVSSPHPLVAAGVGMWMAPAVSTQTMEEWRAALPVGVDTGDIPTQEALDDWARERTSGLIDRFPVEIALNVVTVLATALATKVSWDVPFTVVEASALAPSPWADALHWALRTPRQDPRHRQYIHESARAGTVGVHLTGARGGLLVGSVITTDAEVSPSDLLATAHAIVTKEATDPGDVARLSLFDLPLGEGPTWTLSEHEVETTVPDGREEVVSAVLPAWSAKTAVDLKREELGLPAAARALKKALGISSLIYEAKQSALARYNAVGFEAAAVTALVMRSSKPRTRPGRRREATLRFGHPYAVVAVAHDDHRDPSSSGVPSTWHGLPVFSAWVCQPVESDSEAG